MAEEQANQKSVSMLVYPGVSMLELTGAYSTFNGMKMAKYEVSVVAEHRQALDSDTPLKIVPHKEFSELPAPSVLVVMGGGLPSLRALGNAALLQYINNAAYTASSVIGIGCGALLLAACGLLENRPAATHWAFASLLEAFGARYVRQRWVEAGRFITSAGGTGGMDMGLQYLARHAGEQNARLLQLFAEYDPDPPYGGIDWNKVNADTPLPFTPAEIEALQAAVASQPVISAAVAGWERSMHGHAYAIN